MKDCWDLYKIVSQEIKNEKSLLWEMVCFIHEATYKRFIILVYLSMPFLSNKIVFYRSKKKKVHNSIASQTRHRCPICQRTDWRTNEWLCPYQSIMSDSNLDTLGRTNEWPTIVLLNPVSATAGPNLNLSPNPRRLDLAIKEGKNHW